MNADSMMDQVPGFRLLAGAANIKDWHRDDLALVAAGELVPAAGLFTRNQVAAAPVQWSRRMLKRTGGFARAALLNAGCANACTGARGRDDARDCARLVAGALPDCAPADVQLCSTGVIGRPLPMERMGPAVQALAGRQDSDGLARFARAIMTTDTKPKTSARATTGLGGAVLAGVCKGSGMIAPNMATLLAVVLTDARVEPGVLKTALRAAADQSFNSVTVDGDTSTNDTLLLMASGKAGRASAVDEAKGARYGRFLDALMATCLDLAEQIARDGEGATKLVRVRVAGAKTASDARRAARTIAESPLVKTAMFGNDPNWGRVIMALGRSGAAMREDRTGLRLCGEWMFREGAPLPFDAEALSAKMRAPEVELDVDMGLGRHGCLMLSCDFSCDYVKINADYTT